MVEEVIYRLIKKWKIVLPEFFGFNDVGILFYDKVRDDLCTAGDINSQTSENLIGLDSASVIRFPNTMGVTGQVFKNNGKSLSKCNNLDVIIRNEPKLNPVIDNITNQSEVKNFMIGAILGDKDSKAGVLQFINKINGEEVKNYDKQRFKAMNHFLGSVAENVTLTAVAINLVIMIKGNIGNVSTCLEI